jgi:hypothetical protein
VGSDPELGDLFGAVLAAGDFDGDGIDDLVVGVPSEDVGNVIDAGAFHVFFGSASGLSGVGSQLFTQNTAGVGSTAETFDRFGAALAAGSYDDDVAADLAVGAPGEAVGTVQIAGAINVLFGSSNGLSGIGSQLFTQNTAGVGSTAEEGDQFGAALSGARVVIS